VHFTSTAAKPGTVGAAQIWRKPVAGTLVVCPRCRLQIRCLGGELACPECDLSMEPAAQPPPRQPDRAAIGGKSSLKCSLPAEGATDGWSGPTVERRSDAEPRQLVDVGLRPPQVEKEAKAAVVAEAKAKAKAGAKAGAKAKSDPLATKPPPPARELQPTTPTDGGWTVRTLRAGQCRPALRCAASAGRSK
jgi:hypothetical protein